VKSSVPVPRRKKGKRKRKEGEKKKKAIRTKEKWGLVYTSWLTWLPHRARRRRKRRKEKKGGTGLIQVLPMSYEWNKVVDPYGKKKRRRPMNYQKVSSQQPKLTENEAGEKGREKKEKGEEKREKKRSKDPIAALMTTNDLLGKKRKKEKKRGKKESILSSPGLAAC